LPDMNDISGESAYSSAEQLLGALRALGIGIQPDPDDFPDAAAIESERSRWLGMLLGRVEQEVAQLPDKTAITYGYRERVGGVEGQAMLLVERLARTASDLEGLTNSGPAAAAAAVHAARCALQAAISGDFDSLDAARPNLDDAVARLQELEQDLRGNQ
jgi:hypothetical protein